MEQLLTANVAANLYWFGRHLERVEATLLDVLNMFDIVIDGKNDLGKTYYERMGVTLKYSSAPEFLHAAIFGEHASNLTDVMANARENAIICRAMIDADAFGETMRLHNLFEHVTKSAQKIDYRFLDDALSLINEIWGSLGRGLIRRKSDHFIRLGKMIEKVDLHLRHDTSDDEMSEYLATILLTAKRLAPDVELAIYETDEETNLDAINALIEHLVVH